MELCYAYFAGMDDGLLELSAEAYAEVCLCRERYCKQNLFLFSGRLRRSSESLDIEGQSLKRRLRRRSLRCLESLYSSTMRENGMQDTMMRILSMEQGWDRGRLGMKRSRLLWASQLWDLGLRKVG